LGYLTSLATAEPVTVLPQNAAKPENAVQGVTHGVEIYLPLKGLIDAEKERERLNKENDKLAKEIERLSGKLKNQNFLAKAPANVVAAEREKLSAWEEKRRAVVERLGFLAKL